MRTRLFCLLLALAAFPVSAGATSIEVLQGGVSKGFIEAYSGSATADDNWADNYAGPTIGPAGSTNQGNIFFYDGSDGLSFVIGWNVLGGGYGTAHWDVALTGNGADAGVRVSDDPSELSEVSADSFAGRWGWAPYYDAGAIGELVGTAWEITIDPVLYTSISGVKAFDADGSSIALDVNTSQNIVLRVAAVPESGATLALFGLALAGIGFGRRFFG